MKKSFIVLLLWCTVFVFAEQNIQLGVLFQQGAVFQQNKDIPVWGKAEPKRMLSGEFAGQKVCTKSNASGEFMLRFAPVKAGGPYTLTVTDSKTKKSVTVKDIMVGEVWLASGQSNMEYALGSDWAFPLNLRNNPNSLARQQQKEFCAGIKNPSMMRYFKVPHNCTGVRETTVSGQWKYVNAENAAELSAAAAWFGKAIQEKLNVPVGIIVSAWGGTRVEPWISRERLTSDPDTAPMIREADAALRDPAVWNRIQRKKDQKYWKKDPGNKGFALGFAKPDFNDSVWKNMVVPGSWIVQKISGNGAVWVRKEINLPKEWAGKDLLLETGGIDKHDITYFNGTEVGRTGKDFETKHWDQKRKYTVPGKLVKAGKNVIAIRAFSFINDGSLYGYKEDYKLSLKSGSSPLAIAGVWKAYPEVNFGVLSPKSAGYNPASANTPGILFDGMINPLIPYALRGAIWYQGESNAGNLYNSISYQNRLGLLIKDWRFRWGIGDFPFIQVQLAYFDRMNEGPFFARSPWAYLRDSQRMLCDAMPNVFMVSAIDNGDRLDIHPQDKKAIGNRLAYNALHHVYGFKEITPSGPLYQSHSVEGNKVRITFRYGDGLKLKGDFRKSFYISGNNGVFYPADNIEIEKNTIVVSSKEIPVPAAVRYAWSQAPEAVLYNNADLPASSFRTDPLIFTFCINQ